MRNARLLGLLLIGMFLVPFAYADGPVQMVFQGVNGANDGQYYVSPYYGTMNGQTVTLFCDDIINDVNFGQQWWANVTNLATAVSTNNFSQTRYGSVTGSAVLGNPALAYEEAAWLTTQFASNPGDLVNLERAARVGEKYGNGSLTALPIIETQAGDVSAYIPTNVISITDGQIYLETDLFYQGVRPAISVGLSVSRVGSAAQLKAMKQVAGQLKGDLAQFRELAAFAQFGSELDAKTQAQIDRGKRIMEIFKQAQYSPVPVETQIAVIWAVQNGYVDDVPVNRVKEFQSQLMDLLTTRKPELLARIAQEKSLTPDLIQQLKAVLDEFKQGWD